MAAAGSTDKMSAQEAADGKTKAGAMVCPEATRAAAEVNMGNEAMEADTADLCKDKVDGEEEEEDSNGVRRKDKQEAVAAGSTRILHTTALAGCRYSMVVLFRYSPLVS